MAAMTARITATTTEAPRALTMVSCWLRRVAPASGGSGRWVPPGWSWVRSR